MAAEVAPEAAALSEVYTSYKRLALSFGASLILAQDLDALHRQTRALRELATSGRRDDRLGPAFEACTLALDELARATSPGHETSAAEARAAVETVRARHRWLQRLIWRVLPFEYQPCAAGDRRVGARAPQEE